MMPVEGFGKIADLSFESFDSSAVLILAEGIQYVKITCIGFDGSGFA